MREERVLCVILERDAASDEIDMIRKEENKSASEGLYTGRVLAGYGKSYPVKYRGRVYQCALRGKFRLMEDWTSNPVAVGDRVRFRIIDEMNGVIEEIQPRRNRISRPTKEGRIKERIIVANVDQIFVVVSVKEPVLKAGVIDLMLLAAERERVRGVICINKIDLDEAGIAGAAAEMYTKLRYTVILVSAKTGAGMDALEKVVAGKFSVFIGQSGVGKSSLINRLVPGLNQRVQEISKYCGKGKHTTAFVIAVPYGSGLIADTPGFKDFGLWGINKRNLREFFREFRRYDYQCKFQPCFHISEPRCAVKDAYQAGKMAPSRYENYVRIFEALERERRLEYGD